MLITILNSRCFMNRRLPKQKLSHIPQLGCTQREKPIRKKASLYLLNPKNKSEYNAKKNQLSHAHGAFP